MEREGAETVLLVIVVLVIVLLVVVVLLIDLLLVILVAVVHGSGNSRGDKASECESGKRPHDGFMDVSASELVWSGKKAVVLERAW